VAAIVARELLVSGLRVAALGATRSRGGPCSSRSYWPGSPGSITPAWHPACSAGAQLP